MNDKSILTAPCPSPVFLEHASQWLLENPNEAAAFMSSVLNQLNWAFSEFIGMLQEVRLTVLIIDYFLHFLFLKNINCLNIVYSKIEQFNLKYCFMRSL